MKKIGIMSMQRVVNYGSFLQAYGLSKTIKSLGYDVCFVDYKFEKDILKPSKKDSLTYKILTHLNILDYIKKKNHLNKFKISYINELKKIGIDQYNYDADIDTLVIGSDEVFNCLQHYPVGYSRNLFGYGYEKHNIISYAASFGHTSYLDLVEYGIDKEITYMLNKFKSISVRDKNSFDIVKSLDKSLNPIINYDPVIISDYTDDIKDVKIDFNNYIVLYAYTDRLSRREEKYIKQFAKKYNKKIISLGFYQKCADYNLIVSPLEVLKYIQKADFVITDTFHGTVFSIKMNTKFCSIIRKSNKNKLLYLLTGLKQQKQIVEKLSDIEEKFLDNISFDESNSIMIEERKKSIEYLKNNL